MKEGIIEFIEYLETSPYTPKDSEQDKMWEKLKEKYRDSYYRREIGGNKGIHLVSQTNINHDQI